jgi:cholesterol transport system auxiliary component
MNAVMTRDPNSRARFLAKLALAATPLLFALGACSLLGLPGSEPPPRLFTLEPKTTFAVDLPKATWQLVVEMPNAPASLDTVRIAVRRQPLELEYYAKTAWTDRISTMVQTLLVESFENTHDIVAVARDSAGLRADYALQTDVRHMEATYSSGKPEAHVEINAKLVSLPLRAIIGNTDCVYRSPAASDKIEDIVEAFNDALGRCMKRLVEFTLKTGKPPPPLFKQD